MLQIYEATDREIVIAKMRSIMHQHIPRLILPYKITKQHSESNYRELVQYSV